MNRSLLFVAALLLAAPVAGSATLKQMVDAAPMIPGVGKRVVLKTGVTYTGGLYIGRTFNRITAAFEGNDLYDVKIVGNGAILDLQGAEICIAYCDNRLDIENCVVTNGDVRYKAYDSSTFKAFPVGSVRYVTFYRPLDYGVRVPAVGKGILLERNIVVDAVCTGDDFIYLTGYSNDWLPTGISFAFSINNPYLPDAVDNWVYHSDPARNGDPNGHFSLLCEYG